MSNANRSKGYTTPVYINRWGIRMGGVWSDARFHVMCVSDLDKTEVYKRYVGDDLNEAIRSCEYARTQGYAEVYIYDWTTGKAVTRGQVRAHRAIETMKARPACRTNDELAVYRLSAARDCYELDQRDAG